LSLCPAVAEAVNVCPSCAVPLISGVVTVGAASVTAEVAALALTINHYYGGRGVYFDTPDGNLFEIITQPYGAVPESLDGRDAAQAR
jgi:hypothetical protein